MTLKLQGPRFPSYDSQPRGGQKRQWVRHSGLKQRMRVLEHQARPILDNQDPGVLTAVTRLSNWCSKFPAPRLAILVYTVTALNTSRDTGASWEDCITYLLDTSGEAPEHV